MKVHERFSGCTVDLWFSYMASHRSAMFATFHDVPSFGSSFHKPIFPRCSLRLWPQVGSSYEAQQNNRTFQRRNCFVIARGRKSCILTGKWHGVQITVQICSHFLGLLKTSLCMTRCARRIRASLPSGMQSPKNLKRFFLGGVGWGCVFPKFTMKAKWLCNTP